MCVYVCAYVNGSSGAPCCWPHPPLPLSIARWFPNLIYFRPFNIVWWIFLLLSNFLSHIVDGSVSQTLRGRSIIVVIVVVIPLFVIFIIISIMKSLLPLWWYIRLRRGSRMSECCVFVDFCVLSLSPLLRHIAVTSYYPAVIFSGVCICMARSSTRTPIYMQWRWVCLYLPSGQCECVGWYYGDCWVFNEVQFLVKCEGYMAKGQGVPISFWL